MTTYTLNPSAQSGLIASFDTVAYASARAGTGFIVQAYPGNPPQVGQFFTPGDNSDPENPQPSYYQVMEGFLDFDVSSVVGTITSATLSLGLNTDGSDNADFTVQARVFNWGATLTSGDWVPGASLSGDTLLATLNTSGIGSTGSYKAMTESGSALRTAVAGGGVLRLVLCSDRMVSGTVPDGGEYAVFEAYNHSTLKAKLVVVTSGGSESHSGSGSVSSTASLTGTEKKGSLVSGSLSSTGALTGTEKKGGKVIGSISSASSTSSTARKATSQTGSISSAPSTTTTSSAGRKVAGVVTITPSLFSPVGVGANHAGSGSIDSAGSVSGSARSTRQVGGSVASASVLLGEVTPGRRAQGTVLTDPSTVGGGYGSREDGGSIVSSITASLASSKQAYGSGSIVSAVSMISSFIGDLPLSRQSMPRIVMDDEDHHLQFRRR